MKLPCHKLQCNNVNKDGAAARFIHPFLYIFVPHKKALNLLKSKQPESE